jgi:hypothetical protein
MTETLYYERPVLLDREKHRRWRVKASHSFAFARKANSLCLAGVEFNEAMKEYAIVFTRLANGKIAPVAMLGLRSPRTFLSRKTAVGRQTTSRPSCGAIPSCWRSSAATSWACASTKPMPA